MNAKRALVITACFVFICFEIGSARAASSLWDHNGSTVYLTADGGLREFHYNEPRSGMLQAGARSGSLLFTGRSINGRYVGTAYLFNSECGQIPYRVSGPILDDSRRVVLEGQAPRVDANCNILGYYTDTLEFSYLKSARIIPPLRDTYAGLPPLTPGVELRIVSIGTYDVLTIREYPTERSRIIDVIPSDMTGVVYLGESQGQWVFVRYERAKGWVNRVFVEPMVSRGTRF